jgi:RNA polymerase sigma factor (sigma-70 family)
MLLGQLGRARLRDAREILFSACHEEPRAGVVRDVEVEADDQLVARLCAGDRTAFRRLYAVYRAPTFRFLARLTGRRDWAEDLHQETWLRIARGCPRLSPDTRLSAWVFAVARNVHRTARRRAAVTAILRAEWLVGAAPGSDVTVDDPTCGDLERALRALPVRHREVLLLLGVEGLDVRQAAEALGLHPDAVRQRLSRARAALEHVLRLQDDLPADRPRTPKEIT